MIELEHDHVPNSATARQIDMGGAQNAVGGTMLRINRPGNRFEVDLTFPIATSEGARVLVARLNRAISDGLRVEYPLQGVSQGDPGVAVVVDGNDSAGRTLKLRGLTVGHAVKEGFWLNLIDAGGTRYLHQASAFVLAGADGKAVLTIEPPLRVIPADGWAVELASPVVEGIVMSVVEWAMSPGQFISGLTVTLREAA